MNLRGHPIFSPFPFLCIVSVLGWQMAASMLVLTSNTSSFFILFKLEVCYTATRKYEDSCNTNVPILYYLSFPRLVYLWCLASVWLCIQTCIANSNLSTLKRVFAVTYFKFGWDQYYQWDTNVVLLLPVILCIYSIAPTVICPSLTCFLNYWMCIIWAGSSFASPD